MKRCWHLLIGLLTALAVWLLWVPGSGPAPLPAGAQLVSVLSLTPVTPAEAVLQARVRLEEVSPLELRDLGLALLPPGGVPVAGRTDSGYLFQDPARGLTLQLRVTPAAGGSRRLFAELTCQDMSLLPPLEQHWHRVFASRGWEAEYAAWVAGTLAGPPSYNELQVLFGYIFQALDVQKTWQTVDGRLVSWAGHSPRIKYSLRDVRGEPVNIQAAARYQPGDDRTHIYLGSPLIYRDY